MNSSTKYLLVSHAAYCFWEKRYGIELDAVSGLSPTQEPTQKELQNIIKESKEQDIYYVIFEQNVQAKVAKIPLSRHGPAYLYHDRGSRFTGASKTAEAAKNSNNSPLH
ncbi:ABC-type Zn uptake system ZnuABC Zn-binding protein ZnuA [Peribacillus deserti]|uniref:ABC-type Zn uptake system ZnuABC Zn-binding protein ZnuA n=1 Tax=Peribacillus deserti TaxID=673318 RepID=A0ABS2QLL8_9BACI|nr:ABC-type Zn uptake system ZnuABC Zn-binding protein ZnuA [Peribacillus deserti]